MVQVVMVLVLVVHQVDTEGQDQGWSDGNLLESGVVHKWIEARPSRSRNMPDMLRSPPQLAQSIVSHGLRSLTYSPLFRAMLCLWMSVISEAHIEI